MATETTIKDESWKPTKNPWLLALPTLFAAFMFVLDETIANVALPHMAGTFSASREESTWILTSYLVASGIMIPAVDWFSKLMGRKNFFIMSIIIFTTASALCGVADSLEMMIFARVLQGFGGGGLLPISQAVLLEAFPPNMRGKAMSIFGLVIVVAPIIGPVVGGYITDNYSWPWIFFINLPIGVFTAFLAKALLEDPPYAQKQNNVKIDGKGFFFLTIWLITLQTVLDKGNNADWFNAPWICWMSFVSIVSAIFFFRSQIKNKDSLIDLSVFKDKNFTIGTFVQVVVQAVLLASLAVLPQFLQGLLGYTAFLSGTAMMPRGIGAFIAMACCGILSTKIDNRILVIIGLSLICVASFSLGNLNLQISNINIGIPNFIFGLGMGLAMVPLISLSVVTLKNSQMTNASGLQNLLKNIGGAIGTSIITTIISRYAQAHQFMMVGNLHELNPVFNAKIAAMQSAFMNYTSANVAHHMAQYSLYGDLVKQANLWGFIEAFRLCGVAAFITIPLIFLVKKINLKKQS
ncbi:MAG: DHA2 family efflux MFS transporter permease subunit [Candidatus Gastranaerophilales bacterium]|nr:DHA2 family efflux MFS transporter permease subunit [Candidatus Gastranaerophilales bacterium]